MSASRQARRQAAKSGVQAEPITNAFPKVRLTGGPHGKNMEFTVDGKMPPKVHRVELSVDVTDVVRIKTYQFAEVFIDVEAPAGVENGGWLVQVRVPDIGPAPDGQVAIRAWRVLSEVRGADLKEAVRAAARAIPKDFEVPVQ